MAMPMPVGPVPGDPNDPDLWDEWYDTDTDDDALGHGFGWPLRMVALVIVVAIVALLVLAG